MILVFGSNTQGWHGKGAALDAKEQYGAVQGVGAGRTGQAYAIPTRCFQRGRGFYNLPLMDIRISVHKFLHYAKDNPMDVFLVTRIGCGYASRKNEEIAPMFEDAPPNCVMPIQWKTWLGQRVQWHDEGRLL